MWMDKHGAYGWWRRVSIIWVQGWKILEWRRVSKYLTGQWASKLLELLTTWHCIENWIWPQILTILAASNPQIQIFFHGCAKRFYGFQWVESFPRVVRIPKLISALWYGKWDKRGAWGLIFSWQISLNVIKCKCEFDASEALAFRIDCKQVPDKKMQKHQNVNWKDTTDSCLILLVLIVIVLAFVEAKCQDFARSLLWRSTFLPHLVGSLQCT